SAAAARGRACVRWLGGAGCEPRRAGRGFRRGSAWGRRDRRRRVAAVAAAGGGVLFFVAAGATPLGVTAAASPATAGAAALLVGAHLGPGDSVQGPALEVVKERVPAVGQAQEPRVEAGQVLS